MKHKGWIIASIVCVVLIVAVVGFLIGMRVEKNVVVDYGDTKEEYKISRSLMSCIGCRLFYGGSLERECKAHLKGGDIKGAMSKISADFDPIMSDIKAHEVDKVESRIDFVNSDTELFRYYLGKDGRKLKTDAYEMLLSSVDNGNILENIYDVDPAMTMEEMMRRTTKIGTFTTEYATSSPSRRHNIALATSYLNGNTIEKGMTFSFNDVVGERTKERGFEEAKVILNGEYVTGYGGGVCQVSTTLYNAWMLSASGLVYATSHSLPTHYVALSRDAMVSSYNDMILVNNGETPIYVRGYCGIDNVTFEIYGMENEGYYDIESKLIEELPIEDKIVGEVQEGEEYEDIIVSEGVPGYKSEGYLVHYTDDGNLIDRKKIREDVYKCQPRIIERIVKTR